MHFHSLVIELNANKSDSCCLIVIETVPACVSQRVGSGQILLTPGRIYPPRLTPTQQQEAVATHSSCDRDGGQRGPKKTLPSRQRNKTFISFQLYVLLNTLIQALPSISLLPRQKIYSEPSSTLYLKII